jgi:hypothetical protein
MMKSIDMAQAITIACQATASAWALLPAPMARDKADVTPPPIAPPDIICRRVWKGNTIAILASATVP